MQETLKAINTLGEGFDAYKQASDSRIAALQDRIEKLESRKALPGRTGPGAAAGLVFKTANGATYPVVRKNESLVERVKLNDDFDLAEWLNAQINGTSTKAVASGPALVDSVLSLRIIDAIRANSVLVAAGVPTVLVADGGSVFGRITGDPTAHQHTEGANDITVSDVSVDAVTAKPKVIAIRIPLTGEVVADSPNLPSLLETSSAATIAQKADSLGLATLDADTDIVESSAGQDPASWVKTLEAVGSALGADIPMPNAIIGSEADYVARAGQLASTAGSWLGKPPALAGMTEHFTSKIAAGIAYLGGFDRGMILAVRQQMKMEVLRFADPGRYSHELLVHARLDFVVTQPATMYRVLKTVS